MRQSRLGLSALLLMACAGFDPSKLTPPAPDAAEAGVAGFSYDAGVGAQGGRAASPPSGKAGGGSWQLEGGASGDPVHAPEGGAPGGPDDGDALGSVGGQLSDSGGAIAGASARATGGAVGGAGHAGGSGLAGAGGSGGSHAGASGAGSGPGSSTGGVGVAGHAAGGHGATAGTSAQSAAGASSGGANGGAGGTGGGAGAGGPGSRELFFSEYVEGSSSYKALEIRALDTTSLSGCDIATYSNGHTIASSTLDLDANVAAGEVYVLCSTELVSVAGVHCDRAANLSFSGNDAIALECEGVALDVIGQIGVDPKTAWSDDTASTQDQTLRRRCDVTAGDPVGSDVFVPSLEWQAFPTDTFDGLGSPACD